MEEMGLVVKGQRPETFDRRQLSFGKGDRVTILSIQSLAIRIEVLIEIFRFVWPVHENVGLRDCGASEIVGTEFSAVTLRGPLPGRGSP